MQDEKIYLVKKNAKPIGVNLKINVIHVFLSIISVTFLKFFLEGQVKLGIINVVLIVVPFGGVIHGLYYTLSPKHYLLYLQKNDYSAKTKADEEAFYRVTKAKISIFEE